HLAGAPRVGAAAGRDVPVRDLDDADRARHLGRLAEREPPRALRVGPVPLDRPVLPHHAVRLALERLDLAPSRLAPGDLDAGALLPEMGRERGSAEHPLERGGEDVLAGVLLHVVEAPRPLDLGVELGPRSARRLDDVPDPSVLPGLDVGHRAVAERAAVRLLAAALRVEI